MPSRSPQTTDAGSGKADASPAGPETRFSAGTQPTGNGDAVPGVRGNAPGLPTGVRLALGLVILAGAVVRFWGIGFGLPHTQARPDETQVMDVALQYLRGNLWPEFYDYPRLYNYALILAYLAYFAVGTAAGWFHSLAGFLATWPTDWAPFFLVNRSLSAVSGILVIPVVFAMGRRVGTSATGLVAALFMALAYGHARDSHFGTTDTTLVLLCALSVFLLLRADPGRWGRADVAAALLAGLAAATKYNGVVLLAPLALSQLLHGLRQAFPVAAGQRPAGSIPGGSPSEVNAARARSHAQGSLGAFLAALVDARAWTLGAAFLLAFSIGVPFILFDFAHFSHAMREMHAVLSAGLTPATKTNGWWYHLAISLRYGLGLPLLAAGLAGLAITAWRNWRVALLLYAFPVAYFAVAGSLGAQFVRYAWPIVPFLCVSAAVAVTWFAQSPFYRDRNRWYRPLQVALLALAVVYPSAARIVAFDRVIAQDDSRVVAARWISQHAAPGASVMVSGSPFGSPQFDRQFRHWVWDRARRLYAVKGQPAQGEPDWILVQESPLPSSTQAVVTDLLARGYERMTTIRAFDSSEANNYYDRQDAFFVPFAAFAKVRRPGPNFVIYKHPGVRYLPGPTDGRP